MAAEMAEAEGIKVDSGYNTMLQENSTWTSGRRYCRYNFVHKLAGAKAEAGAELDEVKEWLKSNANVRSMGMALSLHCAPAGKSSFTLAENEVEIGMEFTGSLVHTGKR